MTHKDFFTEMIMSVIPKHADKENYITIEKCKGVTLLILQGVDDQEMKFTFDDNNGKLISFE